ncbi:MAG: UPF0182 family membrane protein [Acidimicrobiales bacterium]
MRSTGDLPRRGGPKVASRARVGLVVLGVALFLLLTSLRGMAGFYTDYLWFDSLDLSGVFTGILGAKVLLGTVFSLIFFVVLWLNLFIADRLAPRFRPAGPEEEVIERYHELVGHRTGMVRIAVAAVFALIAGAGVSARWNDWILFTNARDFGVDDPLFGTDVGFYVFQLPLLTFLVDWAFASLVIITIVTAVAHYLNGGIRFQGAAQRVTVQVKAHLSVLFAGMALLRALGYWLQRYELTFSTRGTVDGATYTDVNAQLPALNLLILISLAALVLFILNIWRRGWILPALAVGSWALAAVVVGGLYPAFVQRFQVEPAESSREAPFIRRNIDATRAALDLANVRTTPFAAEGELDGNALQDNAETVRNIRLWDPELLLPSYQRLQEVRPQYQILDVDVDRYELDGELTQVELSARELDTPGVPQDSWEARHLTYTHGYGAVAAPANSKTADGRPELVLANIPVDGTPSLNLEDEPGIYVGEGLSGYVVVNTDREEIDFQNQDGTVFTSYDGADGVGMGSYFRRIAFALRFGDINPLVSSSIRPGSKILYQRDIAERVRSLAPFLSFDADPYVVIVDGRLQYVIDAYTTSDRYPYAQRAETGQLSVGSGLDHGFNYARNSVKAVIDAYDGTVTFYVVDDTDPLVAAYRQAFPDLFTDGADVPEEVRAHFRYPEDLFRAQTTMWGRYHIDDPDDFYNFNDGWNVAQDPGSGTAAEVRQQLDPTTGQPLGPSRESRIDPYYLLMRLPGDEDLSFVMLRPFVPVSDDDNRKELTAFMVAKSDPDDYGELETFVMPRGELVDGPAIVGANMQQDEEVSRFQTLLGGQGSEVRYGNLVIIPIDQSLLYVRPFYVVAPTTQIPELRKVIVSFAGTVVVEDTLQQALIELFGEAPETLEDLPVAGDVPPDDGEPPPGDPPPGGDTPPGEGEPTPDGDVAGLLTQAQAAFDRAEAALAGGDLGTYQREVQAGADLVARAREQADPTVTTTTAPPDVGSA